MKMKEIVVGTSSQCRLEKVVEPARLESKKIKDKQALLQERESWVGKFSHVKSLSWIFFAIVFLEALINYKSLGRHRGRPLESKICTGAIRSAFESNENS